MTHNSHTLDGKNKDIGRVYQGQPLVTADDYLAILGDWVDPFPAPVVEEVDGFKVVREDLLDVGSKARLCDALVAGTMDLYDEYVYCQPRVGYAGISLSYICQRRDKKCTLWCPEAKTISEHQQRCKDQGAELKFHRIYGMSGLRKAAREYAAAQNAKGIRCRTIEMGLKDEPLCTAAFINAARMTGLNPKEVWTVLSTGQMTRSLQIAWPDAVFNGVAVARNMHEGECGRIRSGNIFSHPFDFFKNEKEELRPPFPSEACYDAKVWRYMKDFASPGAVFWNVAGKLIT